jgi:hypothetical protein
MPERGIPGALKKATGDGLAATHAKMIHQTDADCSPEHCGPRDCPADSEPIRKQSRVWWDYFWIARQPRGTR